jgi:hypothetical protein
MFTDTTLQIFLTLYHGQLMSILFYDYVVRYSVSAFLNKPDWNVLTSIGLGVVGIIAILWATKSTWAKNKRNLLVWSICLAVMFVVLMSIGIVNLTENRKYFDSKGEKIAMAIFITQMCVHVVGIVATWLLYSKSH